jgi:sigma-B regulation protein RsbU (phosphoserine phosphatase)
MELYDGPPVDEVVFLDKEARVFISEMGKHLADYDDSDAILTQMLVKLTEFLDAEEGSVFLVDESTGNLVLTHAAGKVGAQIIGLELQIGQGVVGWVVKYSEDLIVPYPGLDARFFEGVDERTGYTTRSILCGPIRVEGETIGAIEILNKKQVTFNDDDIVVLRAIARLAANVIVRTDSP